MELNPISVLDQRLIRGDRHDDIVRQYVEKMPGGYMMDVGSLVTIMPGKQILFSIPINHVSKRWHIEIPFEFDLPKGKGSRDPKVSLGPSMIIEYSMEDLPPEFRAAVEKR